MDRYKHTQYGSLHLILLAVSVIVGTAAVFVNEAQPVRIGLLSLSAVFVGVAGCFSELTVRDRGDRLTVRFGRIPLFGWSASWDTIESVEIGRSSWIDGWGVHWLPGRGLTINLSGQDCVVLRVNGHSVRIGTDDPEGLLACVQQRIAESR